MNYNYIINKIQSKNPLKNSGDFYTIYATTSGVASSAGASTGVSTVSSTGVTVSSEATSVLSTFVSSDI